MNVNNELKIKSGIRKAKESYIDWIFSARIDDLIELLLSSNKMSSNKNACENETDCEDIEIFTWFRCIILIIFDYCCGRR